MLNELFQNKKIVLSKENYMNYLIIAGGELLNPTQLKEKLSHYDKIIAVDSGYNHCISLGLNPDILIGDMDSVTDCNQLDNHSSLQSKEAKVTSNPVKNLQIITAHPEKDDTDLKLAVNYALENNAISVTFACATGGRLDHFLNNLSILEYTHHQGIQCEMIDEVNKITILAGSKNYHNTSKYISLIPITETVTGSGTNLKYPMEELTIHRNNILSVSNEATADTFTINISQGKAFVIQAD